MSGSVRRRDALARIAALAVAPALASRHEVFAASGARFDPPFEPMVFTRRLVRELGPGAAIDVKRSFGIRFRPLSDGYAVDGEQESAHVDAPASLAALARLEEQRIETGIFPCKLNMNGTIIAGPGGKQPADMSKAVEEAFAWIARHKLGPATSAAAREFVFGLQTVASGLTSAIPIDLFTGAPVPLQRTEELVLPDGRLGHLQVSYNGTPQEGRGILQFAQRIVVTEAAGTVSRSLEEWTLDYAAKAVAR